MKRLLILPVLILLFNVSCEDPLEGNIVPYNTNTKDFKAILPSEPDYTHWVFPFSTEGKPDDTHFVATNPDTGSKIFVEVIDGVITNVIVTPLSKFLTFSQTNDQANQQFELINPSDPIPSQPYRLALGELNLDDKLCYSWIPSSEHSSEIEDMILVSQPRWEIGITGLKTATNSEKIYIKDQPRRTTSDQCTPTSGEASIFIPIYL